MQYTKRFATLVLAVLLAVSLFLLPSCRKNEADSPSIEMKNLIWPVSVPLPTAEQFVASIPKGCTVKLAGKYQFSALGTYPVSLILTDEEGREFSYTASITLVNDTTPPTINGLRDLVAYLGGTVSYLSGVSATDDCDAGVTLTVDNKGVNLKEVGVYDVIYCATDAAGNETKIRRTLSVYEEEITDDMLYDRIDLILSNIIRDNMTTQEKLRAIYDYVYENVAYVSTSDKSSWVRAAYNGIVNRSGDCFTYFALSKAMMERLGIENMDIERKPEIVAMVNERHYWSLVNIGSKTDPKWYHFDSCHLIDMPRPWGFLMTDEQLLIYSDSRENTYGIYGYFYAYDTAAYPPSATEIVTPYYR